LFVLFVCIARVSRYRLVGLSHDDTCNSGIIARSTVNKAEEKTLLSSFIAEMGGVIGKFLDYVKKYWLN
jgi:membrane protein YqaA with SNARE-associated domain